jgi:hypothetical protein
MLHQAATVESLTQELEQRVETLLQTVQKQKQQGLSWEVAHQPTEDFKKWFLQTFFIERSTTPKGGKVLKEQAKKLLWLLTAGVHQRESLSSSQQEWASFQPLLPQFIRMFADVRNDASEDVQQGNILREYKTSLATYRNDRGLASKTFLVYVQILEQVFKSLKGWRAKALQGNLTVSFAGPAQFRGTSAGKYVEATDTLMVRATPTIMKRSPGKYGSPEYIFVHELGHRYDHKISTGVDFQSEAWYTTRYSRTEGFSRLSEAFAELFALGHYDMRNVRGDFGAVVDKFEALMQGRDTLKTAVQRLVSVQRVLQRQASESTDFDYLRERNLQETQEQHPELDVELRHLQDSEYFEEAHDVTEAISSAAYELGYVEHLTEVPPWLKKLGKVFKVDVKKLCTQGKKDAEA